MFSYDQNLSNEDEALKMWMFCTTKIFHSITRTTILALQSVSFGMVETLALSLSISLYLAVEDD